MGDALPPQSIAESVIAVVPLHTMKLYALSFAAVLTASLSQQAFAQSAPILRVHTTEVGGFLGASYGIDKARVMGGGNVVYSLTRALMVYGEGSYFPGIGRTANVVGLSGAQSTFSIPITDFNFGVHLRIPIPKSRIIPYGVLGFGVIHSPSRTENFSSPDPFKPGATVQTPFPVPASTDFATSFGGGLRYYTTERLGFRAEFKGYKPTGTYTDMFYRVTGGIFFQF
jgi:hypothetical protein